VSHFVCNSRRLVAIKGRRERCPKNKLCVIYNGIDAQYFCPDAEQWPSREELGLPAGNLFATVANFRHTKGYGFYLHAIAKAMELGLSDHARFCWIGAGPLRDSLVQKARLLGVEHRILLPGAVVVVRPYLANADSFVLSSREEGMPRAMMEGMAMGLPVLCTDVGGNAEVVRAGIDGLVVPYGAVQRMAEGLIKFEREWMHADVRSVVRQRILDSFRLEHIASEHRQLFDSLLVARENRAHTTE
jgi:glycosyltransferase involved in cell wall biosynthesis